ncbi:MBL fold metallo-hydrolase [Oceanobacillus piezotolerans]|uniref:MBL fold metallo-hydrolase n=1 Tax=Oceanobacillus piezotolerans TaxID=2448030 RepID=A0A498D8C8_9BACI|nr:MBL fold metallo-hydrolase [Oceanobacillus piezotolerans]RLL46965.1 MBL fold metallo-hydrolase [Oceanobacillus piezotolerans]
MKTQITFWGGLDTIGGNIAEVTYGNDRVIFDYGLVYNPANAVMDAAGKRGKSRVLDLLKLDAIPRIDGVYSESSLQGPSYLIKKPVPEEKSTYQTGVFISHLHLDHIGVMDTISPNIPVYMTEGSKRLFHVLEQVGEGLPWKRTYTGMRYGESMKIGEIRVTAFPVDHDIIGAASYLIETPDQRILYSGDLRMHGAHPEYIQDWLNVMREKEISMLLMEGTSFRPEQEEQLTRLCKKEEDIKPVAFSILKETNGLALFNMYHRNVERIRYFIDAAREAGRIPILEWETARIADEFINGAAFMIYREDEEGLPTCDLLEKYESIGVEQINQRPEKYLLQNSYHYIYRLLDLNLYDSVYLHANGVPLGAFDPAYATMKVVLEKFGVSYKSLDVSGHATKEDVLHLIDQIKPKLLVPWHSHYPELVMPLDEQQEVLLPEKGKVY